MKKTLIAILVITVLHTHVCNATLEVDLNTLVKKLKILQSILTAQPIVKKEKEKKATSEVSLAFTKS